MTAMGKIIVSTSLALSTLGLVGALAVFLSQVIFTDMRASAADFRLHEKDAQRIVAELRGADALHEQAIRNIDNKLDSIDKKLDRLLSK